MTTLTIRTADDVYDVVTQVMGFTPVDSIVVLAIGTGGPHARVDTGTMDQLTLAISPAVRHWIGRTVLVVGLGSDAGTVDAIESWLTDEGVNVAHAFDMANRPGTGREALTLLVSTIDDADEADRRADQAWKAGDGALSWEFLDRARALRGHPSLRGELLAQCLTNAVNPHTAS